MISNKPRSLGSFVTQKLRFCSHMSLLWSPWQWKRKSLKVAHISSVHSPMVRTGHMVPTHLQGKLGNVRKHIDIQYAFIKSMTHHPSRPVSNVFLHKVLSNLPQIGEVSSSLQIPNTTLAHVHFFHSLCSLPQMECFCFIHTF